MSAIERINAAAGLIVPEIILLASVVVMFLVGPFWVSETGKTKHHMRHFWGGFSLFALAGALVTWALYGTNSVEYGLFQSDDFVWFVRGVSFTVGAILVLLAWNQTDDGHSAETFACLLTILAGINLTAAANDLAVIFIGLEMVSIPTYVLLYLPRRDRQMREATLKYFLLSLLSAGTFLYGIAWLFGAAGTTNLDGIAAASAAGKLSAVPGLILVAQTLLIAGLGFRMTAVPFHFYAPDVFQGATSSVAGMLAFIPKLAAVIGFIRLIPLSDGALQLVGWQPTVPLQNLLGVVAILTMFAGNLMALRQTNLLRLMAYSSVAHAGYMLAGIAVGAGAGLGNGLASVLFYLVVYGIMTLGAFAVIGALGTVKNPIRLNSDLAGLGKTRPALALALAVLLLSMTGLPPTAGMLGKLYLFLAIWSDGSVLGYTLAVVLGINAAISAGYYLRLIGRMYLEEPQVTDYDKSTQFPAWIAAGCCVVLMVGLFFAPQALWGVAQQAIR